MQRIPLIQLSKHFVSSLLCPSGTCRSKKMWPVSFSQEEVRKRLASLPYHVTQERGTEKNDQSLELAALIFKWSLTTLSWQLTLHKIIKLTFNITACDDLTSSQVLMQTHKCERECLMWCDELLNCPESRTELNNWCFLRDGPGF